MINLEQTFTPRVNPADANYPFGSIKDNTSSGANDGTPLSAVWGNNLEGFQQAAMTRGGITPSGLPDTAQDSQLLTALDNRYLVQNKQSWTATTGGTLTDDTQTFLNDIVGSAGYGGLYSWAGAFPVGGKVVAAGTDPAATPGYTVRSDARLRDDLAETGSTVSIAGLEAGKVKTAADDVRAVTIITGAGTQDVTAAQIGSSLLFTSATTVRMPTIASLGGVTGHYRIMAGSNPITLTRGDGLLFTVRGATVASVTIPAGSDCYVAYSAGSGVYVFGLATYETIVKSYCLVNAPGTGAPNELVSAALPVNIAPNTRYVLTNPFGANVPVICWAEVFYNGKWADTGWLYSSNASAAYGVAAIYVQGEGIIIQTASTAILGGSAGAGGGHGVLLSNAVTSAPCRVFIQKLGA